MSAESTLRLVRLFKFFETARSASDECEIQHEKPVVGAYSAHLNASRFWEGLRPGKSPCQAIFLTRLK